MSIEDNGTGKGLSSFTFCLQFLCKLGCFCNFFEAFPYVKRLQTAVSNHPIIFIHEKQDCLLKCCRGVSLGSVCCFEYNVNLLTKEFIIFQINLCKLGFAARLFYKENTLRSTA